MALYVLGIAICLAAVLQMGMWISSSLSQRQFNRFQLDAAKKLVELQIKNASTSRLNDLPDGSWNGYREFFVDRLEKECRKRNFGLFEADRRQTHCRFQGRDSIFLSGFRFLGSPSQWCVVIPCRWAQAKTITVFRLRRSRHHLVATTFLQGWLVTLSIIS